MMENYLVFDMGGSSIKYGILNGNGDILNNSSFKTPATLDELYSKILEIKNNCEKYNICGVALSCPGAVNSDIGTIDGVSAIPYIHGPNLKTDLESLLNVNYSPLIEVGASWEVVAFVSQLYLPSSTASS